MKLTKLLIFCFLSVLFSIYGQAQEISIKGKVVDESGLPIPGASVLIKGTTKATSSDMDGNFQMKADANGTLVFSYVGYGTVQEAIKGRTSINANLKPELQSLQEVVVIGYGSQKKKEVTGAVSVLDSKAIERLNPTRVEQALQGQIAGVNVTSSSGSPGSASNIRIRGITTNGNNKPLILVDGNRIEDLSVLNPNDIKNINVLKDATAGIYGVQGANGVILITTKTGRKNSELKFQFDSFTGVQATSKKIDLLNAKDFAIYVNDAADQTKFFVYPKEGTDWQDEVFNYAKISSLNFSASGGTKKSAYTFGISHLDQDGVVGLGKSNYRRNYL